MSPSNVPHQVPLVPSVDGRGAMAVFEIYSVALRSEVARSLLRDAPAWPREVGEREHHGPNQRGQYHREPEVVTHSAAIPRYDSGA